MLTSEFERSGEFLFRWRSYTPLLLIAAGLVSLTRFHYPLGSHMYDTLWDFSCYAISLWGLSIRIAAIGFVPRNTSGRNTKRLKSRRNSNTSGMYSKLCVIRFISVISGCGSVPPCLHMNGGSLQLHVWLIR